MAIPEQLVDALNGVFGKQQRDARAVHAKGIVVNGTFTPSAAAAQISAAPHLQKTAVPIICRLSDFAGVPTIPDADGGATPHGMALRFRLPDGTETDIVTHSFNGFPTANVDDFLQFALALGQSGPTASKPTPLDKFLATHPIAKHFLESLQPPPVSYATLSFFGVNTFTFTNASGKATFGRYQIRPTAGEQFLSKDQIASADANYLTKELRERVARGAVEFKLMLEVADSGDALDDPSIAWAPSRAKVELGSIALTQMAADSAAAERELLFNPVPNVAGIEAHDPMIKVRSDAYLISFRRRTA
jgi:catalase